MSVDPHSDTQGDSDVFDFWKARRGSSSSSGECGAADIHPVVDPSLIGSLTETATNGSSGSPSLGSRAERKVKGELDFKTPPKIIKFLRSYLSGRNMCCLLSGHSNTS